jgi:hypothetical protein
LIIYKYQVKSNRERERERLIELIQLKEEALAALQQYFAKCAEALDYVEAAKALSAIEVLDD